MRISDWSSDVCSSDLIRANLHVLGTRFGVAIDIELVGVRIELALEVRHGGAEIDHLAFLNQVAAEHEILVRRADLRDRDRIQAHRFHARSDEHTSELQSLMRISYAVFCLKKTKTNSQKHRTD